MAPLHQKGDWGEGEWIATAAAAQLDVGRSMGPGTRHAQHETSVAVNGLAVGFGARDAKTPDGERAA